jgi:hypothetical protein
MTLAALPSPSFNSIFTDNNSVNGPGYTVLMVLQQDIVGGTIFSYDAAGVTSPIPNLNLSFDPLTNGFTVVQGTQTTSFNNISQNLQAYGLFSLTLSGTTNARAYLTADTLMARRTNQNYTYNFTDYVDPAVTRASIGRSNVFPAKNLIDTEISEILIFNTPLDPAAVVAVNNYLIKKWKLVLKTN